MPSFVGESIIRQLVLAGKRVRDARVVFFGVTFKENCPDVRNSKVTDIISYLGKYGITPVLVDGRADAEDFEKAYGYKLSDPSEAREADCIVLSVAHSEYRERKLKEWDRCFKSGDNCSKVIIDVKSILDKREVLAQGYCYWRL